MLKNVEGSRENLAKCCAWPDAVLDGRVPPATLDRHFHDEFAIGVIDSGCQAFVYDNNLRLDMPKGSVALIAPGVIHAGWPGAEEGSSSRSRWPRG